MPELDLTDIKFGNSGFFSSFSHNPSHLTKALREQKITVWIHAVWTAIMQEEYD